MGAGGGGGGGGDRQETRNGSFYCEKYVRGGSCDVCAHMLRETDHVESVYYKKKFAIHGHLTHLKPSQRPKLRCFIYLMEDLGCVKQYVWSTTDAGGLQQSLPAINETLTQLCYTSISRVGVPVTLAETSPTSE